MPVWPVAAISTTRSRTRSRKSSRRHRLGVDEHVEPHSARLVRTSSRISAYRPSSSAVSGRDVDRRAGRTPPSRRRWATGCRWPWRRTYSWYVAARFRPTLGCRAGLVSRVRSGAGVEVRRDPVVHRLLGHRPAGARGVDHLAAADVERDVVDRRRASSTTPRTRRSPGWSDARRRSASTARTARRSSAGGTCRPAATRPWSGRSSPTSSGRPRPSGRARRAGPGRSAIAAPAPPVGAGGLRRARRAGRRRVRVGGWGRSAAPGPAGPVGPAGRWLLLLLLLLGGLLGRLLGCLLGLRLGGRRCGRGGLLLEGRLARARRAPR